MKLCVGIFSHNNYGYNLRTRVWRLFKTFFFLFSGPSAPSGLGCFSSVTGLALHWPEPKDPEILSVYDTAVILLGLNYSALPGNVGHLFANASVTNTSNTYDIKTSLQSGMYYLTGLRLYSFDYTSGDWATAVCQTEYNIEGECFKSHEI